MADLGSHLPVPIEAVKETKEMKLKWLQIKKQEVISRIVHLKQSIEDLQKGKMAELEYALMKAQAELGVLENAEAREKSSVDATIVE